MTTTVTRRVTVPKSGGFEAARWAALRKAGIVLVGDGSEAKPWTPADLAQRSRIVRCHVRRQTYRFEVSPA